MKNKIIIILLFCLPLVSCKSQIVIGEYRYDNNLTNHTLHILQDSTFFYKVISDLMVSESKGTWKVESNNLILNSYNNYLPYEIKEHTKSKKNKFIVVNIKDQTGIVISGNYVIINSNPEVKYYVDSLGDIFIPEEYTNFKYLTIYALNGEYQYFRKKNKSNFLEVVYNTDNQNKIYFDNELLDVRRKRLRMKKNGITFKRIK